MVAAVAVGLDQLPSKRGECNEWFDELAPALCTVSAGCPACLGQDDEHSVSCSALGRLGSKHFLARFPRTVVFFPISKRARLWPTALCQRKRMLDKGSFPANRLCPLDCMCDALRRAKELALDVGAIADEIGWPCLWHQQHVLIYGPRPDGKCQIDDLTDEDEVYYVTQVERALANGFVEQCGLELFHVNKPALKKAVAMPNACLTRVGVGPKGPPTATRGMWRKPGPMDRGHWLRLQSCSRIGRCPRSVSGRGE